MRFLFIGILLINHWVVFSQDYNITSFGALSWRKYLVTEQIQEAIDAAHQNGGGRVIIPKGRYMTGSLIMKSGVELHLEKDALLLGSPDPDHYTKLNRWAGFILADDQHNISITGEGTIDGNGREVALNLDSLFYIGKLDSIDYTFPEMRPKWYVRPQLIEFVNCKNVIIKDVTLKNAACWVLTQDRSVNIVIDNVKIDSDAYWNNDGIDIQDCRNVRVTNCRINASDDGICLKSQSPDYLCDSIYVGNCTVRSSASALKFGTVSHGGFRNVIIENIKIYDTFRSAIAIECVDGGILENVLVQNIEATNTGNAIFIRLGDRNKNREPGKLRNVTIQNMRVEVAFERPDYKYEIRGPELPFFHNIFPSSITGIPGHPVENVRLENIEIFYPGCGNKGLAYIPLSRLDEVPERMDHYPEFSMFGELPAWGLYVRHMDGLMMKNVRMKIDAPDYRPAMVFDDVREVNIEALYIEGDNKPNQIILHNTAAIKVEKEIGILKM